MKDLGISNSHVEGLARAMCFFALLLYFTFSLVVTASISDQAYLYVVLAIYHLLTALAGRRAK